MLIFNPPFPAFFLLPWDESICGNPSCSIANSVLASFASTTAREGLEKALAQAERRETSGMKTLSDDTPVEVEGGGDGGGGGGSFLDPQLLLLDCLRFSFRPDLVSQLLVGSGVVLRAAGTDLENILSLLLQSPNVDTGSLKV